MSLPIEIKDLSVSYGRKRVLSNIFLNIEKGKIYGVVGPNGAGKSTLFKSVLSLIDINAGDIKITGGTLADNRKKIAYVPQKDDVDWNFPAVVNDIVLMGRYPHKKVFSRLNAKDQDIADKAMEQLGIIDLKNRQIGELSGGQQQRVFLARAMAQEADIFLLDEPFVGVDMTTEDRIIKTLKKLATEGKTMLVVHHDLSTVEDYFDMVVLLNQRLIAAGPTKSTFTEENISKTYGAKLNLLNKL